MQKYWDDIKAFESAAPEHGDHDKEPKYMATFPYPYLNGTVLCLSVCVCLGQGLGLGRGLGRGLGLGLGYHSIPSNNHIIVY